MIKLKTSEFLSIFLSLFAIILSILINFGLTQYVTNTVGAEAYGFVALSKSFVSYANIFMIALNAYTTRFLTISYMKAEKQNFNKYFSTVFIADLIVGSVLLLAGCVLSFRIEFFLNVDTEIVDSIKLLFISTFFTFYITTINTVFTAASYIRNRIYLLNLVKVLGYLTEIVILVICYGYFKVSVWYVGLASMGMSMVNLVGNFGITKRMIPNAKVRRNDFSFDTAKELISNGLWNSANSLGNALNSGLDLLVSNLMLTGTMMGYVSIAKTISNIVFQLYDAIGQPFQPSYLKCYANGENLELIKKFKRMMAISGLCTNVAIAGFFAVGFEFYQLFIPTQDYNMVYQLTVIAMLPAITEGCVYPLYYIYTLTLKNKFPCVVTIIGGVLNVSGMYLLLKYTDMGVYAVLITTAVIMNFINLVTNPLYMCKCLKVKWYTFYPNIGLNILSCGISVVGMIFCRKLFLWDVTWVHLIVEIFVIGIVGIIVQLPFLLGGNKLSERMSK